ncbi:Peroxisome biogenesis protein 6 [Porphyridium purpureum]|uniref:Peroxisomal ATPase PEX6 n=1 Tax=Porphyridium purpureum TaxID=35688 RepID=A0A5J4YTN3_PORPP|nr:Peroxisome biogenesis protein 6 [Porphyridium purpureum]|eukprot:POR4011..scf229_5
MVGSIFFSSFVQHAGGRDTADVEEQGAAAEGAVQHHAQCCSAHDALTMLNGIVPMHLIGARTWALVPLSAMVDAGLVHGAFGLVQAVDAFAADSAAPASTCTRVAQVFALEKLARRRCQDDTRDDSDVESHGGRDVLLCPSLFDALFGSGKYASGESGRTVVRLSYVKPPSDDIFKPFVTKEHRQSRKQRRAELWSGPNAVAERALDDLLLPCASAVVVSVIRMDKKYTVPQCCVDRALASVFSTRFVLTRGDKYIVKVLLGDCALHGNAPHESPLSRCRPAADHTGRWRVHAEYICVTEVRVANQPRDKSENAPCEAFVGWDKPVLFDPLLTSLKQARAIADIVSPPSIMYARMAWQASPVSWREVSRQAEMDANGPFEAAQCSILENDLEFRQTLVCPEVVERLLSLFNVALQSKDSSSPSQRGIRPRILLHGKRGSGKRASVRQAVELAGLCLVERSGRELTGSLADGDPKSVQTSHAKLLDVEAFVALQARCAVIVLRDFDVMAALLPPQKARSSLSASSKMQLSANVESRRVFTSLFFGKGDPASSSVPADMDQGSLSQESQLKSGSQDDEYEDQFGFDFHVDLDMASKGPSSSEQTTGVALVACVDDLEQLEPSARALFTHEFQMPPPGTDTKAAFLRDRWGLAVAKSELTVAPNALEAVENELVSKTAGRPFLEFIFLVSDFISRVAQAAAKDALSDEFQHRCVEIAKDISSRHQQALGSTSARVVKVNWADIGGVNYAKQEILDVVELPLRHPELFQSGVKKRSGLLFYGPPGTGKTMLAKAVASECGCSFLSVKGPELMSMYVGESESNVRKVFSQAREAKPCVIFFDELDSLAPKRGRGSDSGGVADRVVSQLLAEIDGLVVDGGDSVESASAENNIFVIGATNRPDLVDKALLRPGRFDKLVFISPPDSRDAQVKVLEAVTRKFSLADDVDLETIASWLPEPPGLTGADFYGLCQNAWTKALYRQIEALENTEQERQDDNDEAEIVQVSLRDFEDAAKKVVPSLTQAEMNRYFSLRREFEGL